MWNAIVELWQQQLKVMCQNITCLKKAHGLQLMTQGTLRGQLITLVMHGEFAKVN